MNQIPAKIHHALTGLAGAMSTALAAWLVSRLAVAGFNIDMHVLEAVLIGLSGGLVLWVEQALYRVSKLQLFVRIIRFGSVLPTYEEPKDAGA